MVLCTISTTKCNTEISVLQISVLHESAEVLDAAPRRQLTWTAATHTLRELHCIATVLYRHTQTTRAVLYPRLGLYLIVIPNLASGVLYLQAREVVVLNAVLLRPVPVP